LVNNNNLFDEVLSALNLKRAWKQVRANKGAAGVDGLRIESFLAWSKLHWKQCEKQLRHGNYHPSPVRRVEIDKPDGGKRLLGIPTVLDRVIQQAITQVLSPIFEPTFSDNSFGFRPQRNGQQAVKQVHRLIKQKRRIAVDVDLSKFFDRMNHDLMMSKLAILIKDKQLLSLIGRYLRAGIMDKGRLQPSTEGVPHQK